MARRLVRLTARETYALRHPILRAGRPLEDCAMEGDDAPDTRHFGVREDDGPLLAVISFMRRDAPHRPGRAFQGRGMAVAEALQGQGVGSWLMDACMSALLAERLGEEAGAGDGLGRGEGEEEGSGEGVLVWGNARVNARSFYERLGFRVVRGPFPVPGIGPHYLVDRWVTRDGEGRGAGRPTCEPGWPRP